MRILLGTKELIVNNDISRLYDSVPYLFVCSKCGLIHRGAFPVEDKVIFASIEKRQVCASCMVGPRKNQSRLAHSRCPCKYCKYRVSK